MCWCFGKYDKCFCLPWTNILFFHGLGAALCHQRLDDGLCWYCTTDHRQLNCQLSWDMTVWIKPVCGILRVLLAEWDPVCIGIGSLFPCSLMTTGLVIQAFLSFSFSQTETQGQLSIGLKGSMLSLNLFKNHISAGTNKALVILVSLWCLWFSDKGSFVDPPSNCNHNSVWHHCQIQNVTARRQCWLLTYVLR